MKQLLQCVGRNIVVAFDTHAFAGIVGDSIDNKEDVVPRVHTLLPPELSNSTKERIEQKVPEELKETTSGPEEKEEGKHPSGPNPLTVQAVALFKTGNSIFFAVSRHDKTLSIYKIDLVEKDSESVNEHLVSKPLVVHSTAKRACSLAFAPVPGKEEQNSLVTIIAADLAGDAVAFPVVPSRKAAEEEGTKPVSRSLLGHTGSMLTGVCIAQDDDCDDGMKIITADRDEKVRVTCFPQTAVIRGNLLGHTAFVSSLDVASDSGCSQCVTGSGDGTVRLWDYSSCKELARVDPLTATSDKTTDPTEQEEENSVVIVTDVALKSDGSCVALLREGLCKMEVRKVNGPDPLLFGPANTIEFDTQPLAVQFCGSKSLYVVTREPDYIRFIHLDEDLGLSIDSSDPLASAIRQEASSRQIIMPSSTLETDEASGRIKLAKTSDNRAEERDKRQPWNRVERVQKAKIATQRRKRRRRGGDMGSVEAGDDNSQEGS